MQPFTGRDNRDTFTIWKSQLSSIFDAVINSYFGTDFKSQFKDSLLQLNDTEDTSKQLMKRATIDLDYYDDYLQGDHGAQTFNDYNTKAGSGAFQRLSPYGGSSYGSFSSGYGGEPCCPLVLDPLLLSALLGFIAAATYFLSVAITMNIMMARKKRDVIKSTFEEFVLQNIGRLAFLKVQTTRVLHDHKN